MEELVTEHTEVLLEAFWTPQKYHILEQMLVNPFSVVYSEKVILCYFILIKIIGQIPSWYTLKYLYQPFSTGSVLRYIKKSCSRTELYAICYISEWFCSTSDWLLGCVKGIVLSLEKLASQFTKIKYFYRILARSLCLLYSRHITVLVVKEKSH